MVKGYKTINIKEEVVYRIRDYEENKKEIEEERFNLAGFVAKVLLSYEARKKELEYYKREFATAVGDATNIGFEEGRKEGKKDESGLTKEDLKEVLKEVLRERKEQGNTTTTDINAGLTKEDLINIENEAVERIKAIMEGLLTH